MQVGSFKAPSPSDASPKTVEMGNATEVQVTKGNAFVVFYNNGQIRKMDTPFMWGNDKYFYPNKEDAMQRASDLKGAGYNVKVFACEL